MDPSLERAIAERSSSQLGLLTRPQLIELGVSARRHRTMVTSGRLVRVGHRTYRSASAPRTSHQDLLALCLDVGGVASHRSAAALHGLGGFRLSRLRPEVLILDGSRFPESPLGTVHRTTNLGPDDVVTVGAIPATGIARTILGLAALVPRVNSERVRDVVDTAVRDGLSSDDWLWWRLEQLRCRGRNGVTCLESILSDRQGRGRTESWLERRFLDLCGTHRVPLPVVQRRIRRRGAFCARVDFLYPDQRVVVEVNGHGTHSTKKQRDADAARVNVLQLSGHLVLQFTYDDVVRRPADVATIVRTACASRAAA